MANKNNPIGGKPITNILTSEYNGEVTKYYIPSSDSDDIWVNDWVKLAGTSNADGIPIIAKAAAGEKTVGVLNEVKSVLEKDTYIYRKGGEARTMYVVDDPWIELEVQVNGTITTADIGKQADIVVAAGNAATGTSASQLDISTLTTNSAQLKVLGIIEKEGNEWGNLTHIRCLIAEHEFKDIPVYEENLWQKSAGTTQISPQVAGDDLDMGTGNIRATDAHFTGKLTVDGPIDPTALILDAQASAPTTTAGTQYYDSITSRFLFREGSSWVNLGDSSIWNKSGGTIIPDNAGDSLNINTGNFTATDGSFLGNLLVNDTTTSNALKLAGLATAPGTNDGTIYYNISAGNFRFRENSAWVGLGDTSIWNRILTTISPDVAGDDLDMGTGDVTATNATFSAGKINSHPITIKNTSFTLSEAIDGGAIVSLDISSAGTIGLPDTLADGLITRLTNIGLGQWSFNPTGSATLESNEPITPLTTGEHAFLEKRDATAFYLIRNPSRKIISVSADYSSTTLTNNRTIEFTNTSAPRACQISTADVASASPTSIRWFTIKDKGGQAGTNNITISLQSGTIDGAASFLLAGDYNSVDIYVDGTNGWKK